MKLHHLLAAFTLLSAVAHVHAYEQATHAIITIAAFQTSSLASQRSTALLNSLGLNNYAPLGDSTKYFELVDGLGGLSAFQHKSQKYERDILAAFNIKPAVEPVLSWMIFGAIREDDNPSEDPPTPQDVTPGLKRPLNHFYDPYYDRALDVPGLVLADGDVHKNPDWAIGSFDSFTDPNRAETARTNHFTVMDAREAMFRALTLKGTVGGRLVDLAANEDKSTRQQWRQAYWATTLRALGHVLHSNQDMAQPQHVRNEPHSGKYCPTEKVCPTGHSSVYEKYINMRARRDDSFGVTGPFNTSIKLASAPLTFGAYPVPAFAKYTDYWSTSPRDPDVRGKGLAEYSNRNFFSAAKNFGELEYLWPSSNSVDYQIRAVVPTRWDGSAIGDPTPMQVYYGQVRDRLLETSTSDVPLTTFGMWDQFLKKKLAKPRYSLNRLIYDAMAELLLPRAVAYSAGLINFFFRGTIEIALPDEGVFAFADHASDKGFTKLRAKIRNTTPSFVDAQNTAQPQNMTGGTFFAVVRYHTDKQYVASLETIVGTMPCTDASAIINPSKLDASTECRDGIEQIIVSKPLAGASLAANGDASVEFDFADSPIPFGMTDVVLQVVYRGPLGGETDAVAVGTLDIAEPTYFTYQNASDYIHIGEHVYTRTDINARPELLSLVQPQSCVDYRQSVPRLVDECLQPFALDLAVSFGDLANPIASVEKLPERRFIRLVWLTVADEGLNAPAKRVSRGVKVTARRHGSNDKALLYQQGTCLPLDPFDVPPRHSQMTVSPTQIGYRLDRLANLRNVNGWYNTSCVSNGDDATPGATDDRNSVMSPLHPFTDEFVPYPVTIMADYL